MNRRRFSPAAYLPAVTGYYADVSGKHAVLPVQPPSTPILYYNKDQFPRRRPRSRGSAPKTWPEVGAGGEAAAWRLENGMRA